jgi:hypothetical protein
VRSSIEGNVAHTKPLRLSQSASCYVKFNLEDRNAANSVGGSDASDGLYYRSRTPCRHWRLPEWDARGVAVRAAIIARCGNYTKLASVSWWAD